MCCLRALYDLTHLSYLSRRRLRLSAAKEASLLALSRWYVTDLTLAWSFRVSMSDTSLSGWAAGSANLGQEVARGLGTALERTRYKIREPFQAPRQRVRRNPFEDVDTVKPSNTAPP